VAAVAAGAAAAAGAALALAVVLAGGSDLLLAALDAALGVDYDDAIAVALRALAPVSAVAVAALVRHVADGASS